METIQNKIKKYWKSLSIEDKQHIAWIMILIFSSGNLAFYMILPECTPGVCWYMRGGERIYGDCKYITNEVVSQRKALLDPEILVLERIVEKNVPVEIEIIATTTTTPTTTTTQPKCPPCIQKTCSTSWEEIMENIPREIEDEVLNVRPHNAGATCISHGCFMCLKETWEIMKLPNRPKFDPRPPTGAYDMFYQDSLKQENESLYCFPKQKHQSFIINKTYWSIGDINGTEIRVYHK